MEPINIAEEDDLGKFVSTEAADLFLARRLQEEEEARARLPSIVNNKFAISVSS